MSHRTPTATFITAGERINKPNHHQQRKSSSSFLASYSTATNNNHFLPPIRSHSVPPIPTPNTGQYAIPVKIPTSDGYISCASHEVNAVYQQHVEEAWSNTKVGDLPKASTSSSHSGAHNKSGDIQKLLSKLSKCEQRFHTRFHELPHVHHKAITTQHVISDDEESVASNHEDGTHHHGPHKHVKGSPTTLPPVKKAVPKKTKMNVQTFQNYQKQKEEDKLMERLGSIGLKLKALRDDPVLYDTFERRVKEFQKQKAQQELVVENTLDITHKCSKTAKLESIKERSRVRDEKHQVVKARRLHQLNEYLHHAIENVANRDNENEDESGEDSTAASRPHAWGCLLALFTSAKCFKNCSKRQPVILTTTRHPQREEPVVQLHHVIGAVEQQQGQQQPTKQQRKKSVQSESTTATTATNSKRYEFREKFGSLPPKLRASLKLFLKKWLAVYDMERKKRSTAILIDFITKYAKVRHDCLQFTGSLRGFFRAIRSLQRIFRIRKTAASGRKWLYNTQVEQSIKEKTSACKKVINTSGIPLSEKKVAMQFLQDLGNGGYGEYKDIVIAERIRMERRAQAQRLAQYMHEKTIWENKVRDMQAMVAGHEDMMAQAAAAGVESSVFQYSFEMPQPPQCFFKIVLNQKDVEDV
eukprot:PhF_6_TR32150/c1_g1_i2/m.47645